MIQVETMILGEAQNQPKGLDRENKIIQTIMRQLLFALDGLHSTGIVHRDIKPQNVIFSEGKAAPPETLPSRKGSSDLSHLPQEPAPSRSSTSAPRQICESASITSPRSSCWTPGNNLLTQLSACMWVAHKCLSTLLPCEEHHIRRQEQFV